MTQTRKPANPQTREPAPHPPVGTGRQRAPSRGPIVVLGTVILVLSALATMVGLLARPDPVAVLTVRGSTVDLFGAGVYPTTPCSPAQATGEPMR